MKKTLVIVPAFNEARVITRVIGSVRKENPKVDVLVVDDGSTDDTNVKAERAGVWVVRHEINRGLGGAIGTGLQYAKRCDYDMAITFDADGQHDAKDIGRVIEKIIDSRADVVVGSRMKNGMNNIPWDRRLINRMANVVTLLLFGIKTSDSQSGFRGFSKKAIDLIHLRTERMEVSSEVFAEIRRLRLRYAEVPIKVKYTQYSRAKGQSNSNAGSVVYKLMLRLFR